MTYGECDWFAELLGGISCFELEKTEGHGGNPDESEFVQAATVKLLSMTIPESMVEQKISGEFGVDTDGVLDDKTVAHVLIAAEEASRLYRSKGGNPSDYEESIEFITSHIPILCSEAAGIPRSALHLTVRLHWILKKFVKYARMNAYRKRNREVAHDHKTIDEMERKRTSENVQDYVDPDGHLKIPHLWPGQNPPATA